MKRQNVSMGRGVGRLPFRSVRSAKSLFSGGTGAGARRLGAIGLLCALFLGEAALVAHSSRAEAQSSPPRFAIPAYFWSPTQWATIRANGGSVSFAVANVSTGPGAAFDASEAAKFADVRSATTLVGYVNTSYAGWSVEAVLADVDHWRVWYGVTSIFLDQTTATCSDVSYYANVVTAIRSRQTGFVVLNPGANIDECYAPYGDVIVNFEGTPSTYGSWSPAAWTTNYPSGKFWHVVYSASESQLSSIVGLAQARRAGNLYVTPDGMPNPFDTLPTGTYWSSLVALSSASAAPTTGMATPTTSLATSTTGLVTSTTGLTSSVLQPVSTSVQPASTLNQTASTLNQTASTLNQNSSTLNQNASTVNQPVVAPTVSVVLGGGASTVATVATASTLPTRAFVVAGVFVPPTTTTTTFRNTSTSRPNQIMARSVTTSITRPNVKKTSAATKKAAVVKPRSSKGVKTKAVTTKAVTSKP